MAIIAAQRCGKFISTRIITGPLLYFGRATSSSLHLHSSRCLRTASPSARQPGTARRRGLHLELHSEAAPRNRRHHHSRGRSAAAYPLLAPAGLGTTHRRYRVCNESMVGVPQSHTRAAHVSGRAGTLGRESWPAGCVPHVNSSPANMAGAGCAQYVSTGADRTAHRHAHLARTGSTQIEPLEVLARLRRLRHVCHVHPLLVIFFSYFSPNLF